MEKTFLMEMKMLAEDNAPSKEQYLNEGIKYFKNSKKVEKLILKAEKDFEKSKGSLDKEDVKKAQEVIKKMKAAQKEFESVENMYSTGAGKDVAMKKYKLLKTKYAGIYKSMDVMKKVLVTAGIFGSLGIAAAALAYSVAPSDAKTPFSSLEKSRQDFGTSGLAGKNDEIAKIIHKIAIGGDDILKTITKFFNEAGVAAGAAVNSASDAVKNAVDPNAKFHDANSLPQGSW